MRDRSAIALALVYAQILVGGWLRHFATPPALWLHSALAAAVLVYIGLAGLAYPRAARRVAPAGGALATPGGGGDRPGHPGDLGALSCCWPLDGTARPVPFVQAVIRTGHQTNAAILFAASIVLTLRSFRHLAGAAHAAGTRPGDRPVGRPEPAALDWEAVA